MYMKYKKYIYIYLHLYIRVRLCSTWLGTSKLYTGLHHP